MTMILDTYVPFLDTLFSQLQELQLDLSAATIDHIAYRVNSESEYNQFKEELLKVARLHAQPLVETWKVGIFELFNPLQYKHFSIKAVELLVPTDNSIVTSGWEHAELLFPESLEELVKKYPNLEWNTGAMNRDIFPMIKLKLTDAIQVKFPRKPVLEFKTP